MKRVLEGRLKIGSHFYSKLYHNQRHGIGL